MQFTPVLTRVFNFVGLLPGSFSPTSSVFTRNRDIQSQHSKFFGFAASKNVVVGLPSVKRGENKDFLWARGVTSFVKKLFKEPFFALWVRRGGREVLWVKTRVFLLSP